jgi:uncharacterized repeat protein (TIGR01451 family)
MEGLKSAQSNRRLRAVRLAITVGLATLFLMALLCGLREVSPAYADPGILYVDRASGSDTTACTDPNSPCATIGYALDQAEDFDTILVARGTYTENLVITKTITLKGGYEPVDWSRSLRRYTATIDGNQSDRVINVESTLSETTVIDGFTITNGNGGIGILLSSVAIQNSKIVHNVITGSGGGMLIDHSFVTITNTLIADNTATNHEGAMRIIRTAAIPGPGSIVRIYNSIIANNNAANGRNGIFCSNSALGVVNSILWGHAGEDYWPSSNCGNNIFTYSDIETVITNTGNISNDPRFVDPDNGDYHLRPDSPCIDKGTNESAPPTDWEGDPRPLDGDLDGIAITDMGADETGLVVTKQADPDPVKPGAQLAYTIRVTNASSVDLHATITDTLPGHVSPSGIRTWTTVITAPGGVWEEQFTVSGEMGYIGPLVNMVKVTTEEGATGVYTETSTSGYMIYLPIILKCCPGLDEDASEWDIYREGSPTCVNPENVPTPSLDGNALQFAIVGGSPYGNCHYYRNLPSQPYATQFTYTLSFWFTPTTTCNNQGGPSTVQALEFSMSKWYQSKRYEFALQWQNVGNGAPQWRYWDGYHWVPPIPPITQCLQAGQWHTLELEGEVVGQQVHYQRFTIDDDSYVIDVTTSPISTPGEPDRLAIAVQLDGNSEESPYEVFVDKVCLVTNCN